VQAYNLLQLVPYKTLCRTAGEEGFLAVVHKAAEQAKPFYGYPNLGCIQPATARSVPLSLYSVSHDTSTASLVSSSLAEAFPSNKAAFALGWQMAHEWHGTTLELIDAVKACENAQ
jgi:hypothetical protein